MRGKDDIKSYNNIFKCFVKIVPDTHEGIYRTIGGERYNNSIINK